MEGCVVGLGSGLKVGTGLMELGKSSISVTSLTFRSRLLSLKIPAAKMRLPRSFLASKVSGISKAMASDDCGKRKYLSEAAEYCNSPVKAVSLHTWGVGVGVPPSPPAGGFGEAMLVNSKKGILKGRTKRPMPILTVTTIIEMAMAVKGLTLKRKYTPSLPKIFFHQLLRYVTGLATLMSTMGGSV